MRVHPDYQYAERRSSFHAESGWPYANLWRRLIAYLIDLVVVVVIFMGVLALVAFFAGLLGINLDSKQLWDSNKEIIGWIVLVPTYFAYFILRELHSGATVGKRLLGLRVLAESGGPCGGRAGVVRNLIRPVDMVGGCLVALINRRRQRLGDKAAHSVVVRVQEKRAA